MIEILITSLENLFAVLGTFIVFGLIFNVIQVINERLIVSTFGFKGLVVTGYIGTVVHELSHMIMAKIFNHKIVDFKLFRPNKALSDGVFGYVKHSYKSNSLYQRVGDFFIGIAPMIFGTALIWLIMMVLTPNTYNDLINNINVIEYLNSLNNIDIDSIINILLIQTKVIIDSMFLTKNIFSISHIIMLILVYSISTHMTLSKKDIQGSLNGLVICYIVSIILTIISIIFKEKSIFLVDLITKFNIYTISFLMIGLIFSLITLVITFILNRILNN